MPKASRSPAIRLRGVRHNNLKNFDLDLPLRKLIVVTGLSGSGKSSLAFDTLYAEGQRRYLETFSPYARQFFDRMDKPQVDHVEGIPPAIAIEQRNTVKTTRSTVGTMTEICDYMKVLWPHVATLHCQQCGQPVRKDSPQQIWETVRAPCRRPHDPALDSASSAPGAGPLAAEPEPERPEAPAEVLVTFEVPLSEKLSLEESLGLIARQGYQRLLVPVAAETAGESASSFLGEAMRPLGDTPRPPGLTAPAGLSILRVKEAAPVLAATKPRSLIVVQDRLKLAPVHRARFVEACEQAYHLGKGKLAIYRLGAEAPRSSSRPDLSMPIAAAQPLRFSNRLHCAACDLEYREPSPALFSFNHPVGACPVCRGFGRVITLDYDLAIPDRTKSLAEGAVKPWQSGVSAECQEDLLKFCAKRGVPTDVPFAALPAEQQAWVLYGDPDYGKDALHRWPRAWYGVKGYFQWLETKAYKMHVRVLLSRYRAYVKCAACGGRRFQPETLLYRLRLPERALPQVLPAAFGQATLTLADFYALPVRDALALIEALAEARDADHPRRADPITLALAEVRTRLRYLHEVGLGYLTLDRPTRSLSGGETERVNLTTCLGTRLVNTLYVLDEPTVGLHPRDSARLVKVLESLRDLGNTVVVVEHEPVVIRAADHLVDLGPGHGESGGQVVFQGNWRQLLRAKGSLTGAYLSGRARIEIPPRRPVKVESAAHLPDEGRPSAAEAGLASGRDLASAAERDADRRDAGPTLRLSHARRHNLKDLTVDIPLGRFVCVTGVSGSGKTTLVREVLLPALEDKLQAPGAKLDAQRPTTETPPEAAASDEAAEEESESRRAPTEAGLSGWEQLARVVLVDQSPLGRTPRSNPAVYIGAFDSIRELFAQSPAAQQRGLTASSFSFNSPHGQCERCRGAGFEKIEMQFLSDVFIRCPECNGRRYRPHILEVTLAPGDGETNPKAAIRNPQSAIRNPKGMEGGRKGSRAVAPASRAWSIADLLDATVDEAVAFLSRFADRRPARRAVAALRVLQEVGLGYLRLGQPINTLSGGESQRLKLASHLVETLPDLSAPTVNGKGDQGTEGQKAKAFEASSSATPRPAGEPPALDFALRPLDHGVRPSSRAARSTLFLFDEPTTGLHFEDVRVLLGVLQRLVDAGHSVVVIEHNLDVIKCADWVIDLGPEAGDEGGCLVVEGTPEDVAACERSHTGRALREVLKAA